MVRLDARKTDLMRIRIIRTPTQDCIDGIQLDRFVLGQEYEVGTTVGALLFAEGWAEPVDSEAGAVVIPLSEFDRDRVHRPSKLFRAIYPPYYDRPHALAAERRRKPRCA
jgi:hypothetical protein